MKTKQAGNKIMIQRCIKNYKNSEKVASKHEGIEEYFCKSVIAAFTTNMSMAVFVELSKSWCDKFSGLKLGDQIYLPNIYITVVHETLLN